LTVAEPISFGFLGNQVGNIEVYGSLITFNSQSDVSFNSGDIWLFGVNVSSSGIVNPEGHIQLSAIGQLKADVPIGGNLSMDAGGHVIMDSVKVDASGNGNGRVKVHAKSMEMNNAVIAADNKGDIHAEDGVEIKVTNTFTMLNGSRAQSIARASGDSGGVTVSAGELFMDGQGSFIFTGISSDTENGSTGNAGTVKVSVDGLLELVNGAAITSNTWAKGNAGSVNVNAGELKADRQDNFFYNTGITSDAAYTSEGNAGTVAVDVKGLIQLINGGENIKQHLFNRSWRQCNCHWWIFKNGWPG